jgi:peroxiredoxin
MTIMLSAVLVAVAASSPEACARELLEASGRAYQKASSLRDTMRYTVDAPGSEKEPKELQFGFSGRDAFVSDPGLSAWAVGDELYVLRTGIEDKYVSAPYTGDFRAALDAVVGTQGSAFEPGPIGLHAGESYQAALDALRFKQLGPLHAAACDPKALMARFEADNGSLTLHFDPRTHYFVSIALELRPAGAPQGFVVRIAGTYAPREGGPIRFDPQGRRRVGSLVELDSGSLVPGQPGPQFALQTLEGKAVSSADLHGQVVVLDFWATWCAPCWKTLRETQALADWVARDRLPVAVLAVDSLEHLPTAREKRERAAAFWKSQGLTLTSLLDADDALFTACKSPGLPSLVVIGKDGRVAAVHQGLFPHVFETVQREVQTALGR